MGGLRITTRLIDGEPENCIDIGCDDFKRAAYNRYIIKNELFIEFWLRLEAELAKDRKLLPAWVPRNYDLVIWERGKGK